METFALFAAVVTVAHLAGRDNWMTITGANLYFWARLAYIPPYVAGIPVARTVTLVVVVAGILLMFFALT